jgi:23S rRNA (cytosine1962-C5)-methyltransferase
VRLISRNANDVFDDAFWERKLRWAWEYRKSVLAPEDLDCCRILFGEADAFPGLTVDQVPRPAVVQVLSVGMELRKGTLLPLLVRILREDGQDHPASTSATTRRSGKRRVCPRARAGSHCPARRPPPPR